MLYLTTTSERPFLVVIANELSREDAKGRMSDDDLDRKNFSNVFKVD